MNQHAVYSSLTGDCPVWLVTLFQSKVWHVAISFVDMLMWLMEPSLYIFFWHKYSDYWLWSYLDYIWIYYKFGAQFLRIKVYTLYWLELPVKHFHNFILIGVACEAFSLLTLHYTFRKCLYKLMFDPLMLYFSCKLVLAR